MKKKEKRKSYVIDRTFQYRLVGTFLLSIVVALVLFSAGTVLYFWGASMLGDNLFREFIDINKQVYVTRTDQDGVTVRVPETRTVYGVKRWEIVVPPILINNLIIIIVVSTIGIIYSHRIAGPIYRMNADIQRVLDGASGIHVRLRGRDNLQDLARRINLLLDDYYRMKRELEGESG